jgi:hypothetical protein
MRPLIRVSLFNADSENDFTLLEEGGEYFVSFGNRPAWISFLEMRGRNDAQDLLTGDVRTFSR